MLCSSLRFLKLSNSPLKVHWICLALALIALSGCAQLDSQTSVNSDGGYEKAVVFKISKSGQMPGGEKPDIRSYVNPEGEGWKIVVTENDEEEIMTLTKNFSPGESARLYVNQSGNKELESTTTFENGMFKETWKWIGADKTDEFDRAVEHLEKLILEKTNMDATVAKKVALESQKEIRLEMFGPPKPLLSYMFHPQVMQREFQLMVYRVLVSKLTENEIEGAKKHAIELAKAMNSAEYGTSKEQSDSGNSNSLMISMNVILMADGRILESTNGVENPIIGTIEWSLYPEATQLDPIQLTAKFK